MSSKSSSKSSESEDNVETQKITKQKDKKKEKKKNKKNKKEVELVDKEQPKEEVEGYYRKITAPSELIFEKKRGYEFIPKKPIQVEVVNHHLLCDITRWHFKSIAF